jgi:hypothetical protein
MANIAAIIAALAVVGDPYLFPSEPITNLGEFLLYYVLLCAILPFIALWLKHMWNAVIPAVFNTKRISFMESFGILLVSLLLTDINPKKEPILGPKYLKPRNMIPSKTTMANNVVNNLLYSSSSVMFWFGLYFAIVLFLNYPIKKSDTNKIPKDSINEILFVLNTAGITAFHICLSHRAIKGRMAHSNT